MFKPYVCQCFIYEPQRFLCVFKFYILRLRSFYIPLCFQAVL